MENGGSDAAFQAEGGIHAKNMRTQITRTSSGSSRTGELDALAARGGFDPDLTQDDGESRPLLGSGKDGAGGHGDDQYNDFAGLPWYKTPSMFWVLVPFSILAVAYGGIIVPRVNLIINLLCQEYIDEQEALNPGFVRHPIMLGSSNPQCLVPEVDRRSSNFTLYCNLIAGILSAFTSPKLGALSDRFGRTKMIAITSLGSLSGDLLTIAAATHPKTVSVYWILIGFALDGLCGSFTTAFAVVHAYVTDCVPPQTRNVAFGYFHGCLFTGIALGPFLAGLLTKRTGTPVTSFYIMLGVHVFFIIFMGFIAPESLSKRRRDRAREKHRRQKADHATDWIDVLREVNVFEPLKILWPTGPKVNPAVRRNLALLASIDTIMFGIAMGSMTVILIYVNSQFKWDTYEQGVFMSVVNTCRVLCLFVALPLITWFVRSRRGSGPQQRSGADLFDVTLIRVAVLFDTLGYLGYALAASGGVMIFSGVIAAIGGMGSPTLQSALTKHVPPENTGQLLGAMGLLHALARVVAPTVFNGIFSATVYTFRQAVFVCLTATFGMAFVCTLFIKPGVSLDEKPGPSQEDEEVAPLVRSD